MSQEIMLAAILMAAVTAAVRFLPFLIGGRLGSPVLRRLFTDLFPPAVLAVLIVYLGAGGDAPAAVQLAHAAGAAATMVIHLIFRNLLASVGTGTLVCMLIQNAWMA